MTKPRYTLEIEAAANGRIRKATVIVRDAAGKARASDKADMHCEPDRARLANRLAAALGDVDAEKLKKNLDSKWMEILDEQRRLREQQAAGSAEGDAIETMNLLDCAPPTIRRPLTLIDGHACAAASLNLQRTIRRSVDPHTGAFKEHEPPLVTVETVLVIVRDDGQLFTDATLPGARPLAELGLDVRLPAPLPPGREWSGAGVKRYLAGQRPNPAEVFQRVVSVLDRFCDFARSLASQETLCEMSACFVLSTYLIDALHVVGYLWPNGEKGSGKTVYLETITELAYLGQVILAGSSYPCLRDLADYGATLAFDDAEEVMDTRRTDPDKRTLLLAGSRRGATIAVKELVGDRWETRHVNTFCPRLFSAIRLPDDVLGSRSIIVPLVRSGDPRRAKANPMDLADWPTDRRRLIDDLWALGLTHLKEIPHYDRIAASLAELCGRNLDPWRPILAVAAWLQDRGIAGLYDRMELLSRNYQKERSELEDNDRTRILFRALLRLSAEWEREDAHTVQPAEIAATMNQIAREEDLTEPDKEFTTPRRIGWFLKRLRFRRAEERSERGKIWQMSRQEIQMAATAYGVEHEPRNSD